MRAVAVRGLFPFLAACLLTGTGARAEDAAGTQCVAGYYRGSAPEIAAQLLLDPSGRYMYALTYGAIDETSEGAWTLEDGRVVLRSDPVTPPQFVFLGEQASPDGAFRVDLELPEDISRQFFDGQLEFADGSFADRQFSEEGLEMDLSAHAEPVAFRMFLPIFMLASDWQALTEGKGTHLRYRFEPNDIGKVAFDGTALPMKDGALQLSRHERELRLSSQGGSCQAP